MDVDLYNVFVGPTLPPDQLRTARIGPFEVRLIDDYEDAAKSVYKPASVKSSLQWNRVDPQPPGQNENAPRGLAEQTVEQVEEVKGSWVVTARATWQDDAHKSILLRSPSNDAGIWDLCELLTFITGRRVTTRQYLDRFDPNRSCDAACVLSEALLAASVAWSNRQSLADSGLVYALLSHNSACEYKFLQPKAAQYNTALNILIDKWQIPSFPKIELSVRESLAKAVEALASGWEGLTDDDRKGYRALLRSRVMDGPYSMLDRLVLLLRNLEIVMLGDDPAVLIRVRYLNTIRNRLTHSGEMPLLKGLTQEQSDRYTVNIAGGVLQSLSQLAIGKMLGFTTAGPGEAYSLNRLKYLCKGAIRVFI